MAYQTDAGNLPNDRCQHCVHGPRGAPLNDAIYQGIIAVPPHDPTIHALLQLIVRSSLVQMNSPTGYLVVIYHISGI